MNSAWAYAASCSRISSYTAPDGQATDFDVFQSSSQVSPAISATRSSVPP
jgi:hypothetical protein